jgi:hypothetical protein
VWGWQIANQLAADGKDRSTQGLGDALAKLGSYHVTPSAGGLRRRWEY